MPGISLPHRDNLLMFADLEVLDRLWLWLALYGDLLGMGLKSSPELERASQALLKLMEELSKVTIVFAFARSIQAVRQKR